MSIAANFILSILCPNFHPLYESGIKFSYAHKHFRDRQAVYKFSKCTSLIRRQAGDKGIKRFRVHAKTGATRSVCVFGVKLNRLQTVQAVGQIPNNRMTLSIQDMQEMFHETVTVRNHSVSLPAPSQTFISYKSLAQGCEPADWHEVYKGVKRFRVRTKTDATRSVRVFEVKLNWLQRMQAVGQTPNNRMTLSIQDMQEMFHETVTVRKRSASLPAPSETFLSYRNLAQGCEPADWHEIEVVERK
ncbi:hypothetical protein PoB_006663100 [Plakobranchus ocellatus]|uniref:Uncharacterized protein n=1 Tax=Plakobranchus ocellatus TaxID=259542 RepID=A0AAV4D851_9GAST|nr:hypothetical protein PoB_006663100 [Plakobranchus ocellatus]